MRVQKKGGRGRARDKERKETISPVVGGWVAVLIPSRFFHSVKCFISPGGVKAQVTSEQAGKHLPCCLKRIRALLCLILSRFTFLTLSFSYCGCVANKNSNL